MRQIVVPCVIAAAIVATGLAGAQTIDDPLVGLSRTPEGCTFADDVSGEFATLPEIASVEDYEAAIHFAISQSGCRPDAITASLASLNGTGSAQNARLAIENVLGRLLRRPIERGTGAVARGFGTTWSAPVIYIGGGSANYGS